MTWILIVSGLSLMYYGGDEINLITILGGLIFAIGFTIPRGK